MFGLKETVIFTVWQRACASLTIKPFSWLTLQQNFNFSFFLLYDDNSVSLGNLRFCDLSVHFIFCAHWLYLHYCSLSRLLSRRWWISFSVIFFPRHLCVCFRNRKCVSRECLLFLEKCSIYFRLFAQVYATMDRYLVEWWTSGVSNQWFVFIQIRTFLHRDTLIQSKAFCPISV